MNKSILQFVVHTFLIIICVGCIDRVSEDAINLNIEKMESKSIDFNNIFEIEDIIVLEETDNSLVSYIIKLTKFGSDLYISDNQHSKIYRFNENGMYLNQIGTKGNGPGEVVLMTNFRVDEDGLFIMDRFKMLRYNHEGNFLSEFPKLFYSIDFNYHNNNFIIYNINHPEYDKFIILDTTFEIQKSFSPIKYSPFVMGMPGRDYLLTDMGEDYFTYPYSDTIYKLVDTIAFPYVSYGFGQGKFTDYNALYRGDFDGDMSGYGYSFKDFLQGNLIISNIVLKNNINLNIYNVKEDKSILIDSLINGPDLVNGAQLYYVDKKGVFYWGYNSHSQNKSIEDILSGTQLNDNTVLILTKLKL